MPIDYKNYPPNWKTEIRPAILERAKNRCEFCGVENYAIGVRAFGTFTEIEQNIASDMHALDLMEQGYKIIKIVLTIAHLDHDIANNDHSNLRALCQRCHNRHDTKHRKSNARQTNNKRKGYANLF